MTAPSRNDFSDSPIHPTINLRSPSGQSALERLRNEPKMGIAFLEKMAHRSLDERGDLGLLCDR